VRGTERKRRHLWHFLNFTTLALAFDLPHAASGDKLKQHYDGGSIGEWKYLQVIRVTL
jgi:hypothetical protein